MNMAAAVSATSGSSAMFALASLRGGFPSSGSTGQTSDGISRADGANDGAKENAYPRFVSPVLEYNQGAERMVMLFRDPATGKTEDQIPSEAALKQYQEAARRTRSQRNSEALAEVGDNGDTAKSGIGIDSKGDGGTVKLGASFAAADASTETTPAAGTPTVSGYRDTGAPVSSSGGSAGNGSGGVRFNFVV